MKHLETLLEQLGLGLSKKEKEISSHSLHYIDMPRAAFIVTSRLVFTDFRSTYSLQERKAFKLGALLTFLSTYYGRMNSGIIPANTEASGTTAFYDKLENCCVQLPGELSNDSTDLLSTVEQDFELIFTSADSDNNLLDTIRQLITNTQGGESRPSSGSQLSEWSELATSTGISYREACRDINLRSSAYEGAAPFIFLMVDEIEKQLKGHQLSENTELIY